MNSRPRMILLHGAAVAANGGAWLFMAPSETGKSTLSRRLSPYARILVDDRAVIHPGEGEWLVASADGYNFLDPLPEDALSGGLPLRAVFRLYRSRRPRLEALSALQTCRCLTEAFFHFYWQKDYPIGEKRGAFAELAAMARAIPGYRLYFNRSPKTIDLLVPIIDTSAPMR